MNLRFGTRSILLATCILAATTAVRAEDGYRLWLRYDALPEQDAAKYRTQITEIVAPGTNATVKALVQELADGCSGLLGKPVTAAADVSRDGALVVGTPKSSPAIAALKWDSQISDLGSEGFIIRSEKIQGHPATVIAAATDQGALYGAFYFLRLVQTQTPINALNITQKPSLKIRVLDHWDNLDGSIERGYAGKTLWNWSTLPGTVDPRLRDYARADASIGINGAVLNNVNANSKSLSPEFLKKTAAIADTFRPYGLRVYLSARFSSPMELGGLKTADPLDPEVISWWKAKADEIYSVIPDFGGFLVKANSEGQPGPTTYKRTHADGANVLAAALAPHGGIVMWRAFVYDAKPGSDRIGQAYDNLKPFDGQFATNVLLQVKNGALDFQPREPFHQLFGGMTKTPTMPELQVTQEYLGHSTHAAFLATMWREFLDSDTRAKGPGSTVAKVVSGNVFGQTLTGMAGVANTGSDRNWTGHDLAQANWYAYGRLAWNIEAKPETIADEWIRMTLTRDDKAVKTISSIMLESREAVVDYMEPLGLVHIMDSQHYGPKPWDASAGRADWNPVYYHRADTNGIGFDRTSTGSGAINQYNEGVREQFGSLDTCPEKFILFFHHVPWDHKMRSGQTLWDDMCHHYQRGIDWMRQTRKTWDTLSEAMDADRYKAITAKLTTQERDAIMWRDACLLYFQTFSKRPFPADMEKLDHTAEQILPANIRAATQSK